MSKKCDFSGWATKFNTKCSDGRTILSGAFNDNNGTTVPLVWQHKHDSPENVLGHAYLEERPEGMYTYCTFNDTDLGRNAKELVKHGDITSLSIYANRLKEDAGVVRHGMIREVSLVLTGANPGAFIDTVSIAHGDGGEYSAIIYNDEDCVLYHAESEEDYMYDEELTVQDVYDTLTDEQKDLVNILVGAAMEGEFDDEDYEEYEDEDFDDYDEDYDYDDEDYDDYDDVDYYDDEADDYDYDDELEQADYDDNYLEHSMEDDYMNVFENDYYVDDLPTAEDYDALRHGIIQDAKACGSFKKAYLAHCEEFNEEFGDAFLAHGVGPGTAVATRGRGSVVTPLSYTNPWTGVTGNINYNTDKNSAAGYTYTIADAYGIGNFDMLFPEARYNTNEPQILDDNYEWVQTVLSGVSHQPHGKIKTWFTDITADEARARGYIKGNEKWESVFQVFNRETSPTTVYVKQKMDRDDIIDIGENFAVVPYIQRIMKTKLNQEIARAILFGDGRTTGAEDKIDETKIRPIWNDDDFYSIKYRMKKSEWGTTDKQIADALIEACLRARKDYRGSGKPAIFMSEDLLYTILLAQDLNGHKIYKDETDVAKALRVSSIITVPQMEGKTKAAGTSDKYHDGTAATGETWNLKAIIINLTDYVVGTPKGGQISTFNDFDIDFSKEKYLMEGRMGGAIQKPKSAIQIDVGSL